MWNIYTLCLHIYALPTPIHVHSPSTLSQDSRPLIEGWNYFCSDVLSHHDPSLSVRLDFLGAGVNVHWNTSVLWLCFCLLSPDSGPEWQPLHSQAFLSTETNGTLSSRKWVVFPVPVLFSVEGICTDGLAVFEWFSFPVLGLVQPYYKKKWETNKFCDFFI